MSSFFVSVVDTNSLPVPYCVIISNDATREFYSDRYGFCKIQVDTGRIDTIYVQKDGYTTSRVFVRGIKRDSLTVILSNVARTLPEYDISTKGLKKKGGIVGKKRLHIDGTAYMSYGDEMAVFIVPRHKKENAYVKNVFVYVTSQGIPTTKFIVHAYATDTSTGEPGRELTDGGILAAANEGDEWVKIDVSKKLINASEGIFISIEWVAGYGNNPHTLEAGSYLKPFWWGGSGFDATLRNHKYNGQVLGLTTKYGFRGISYISYIKQRATRRWSHFVPVHTGHRQDRWVNPMIYCTY